ncbi:MAG: hypothetical protein NVS9B10_13550 [Nevskia sp.]
MRKAIFAAVLAASFISAAATAAQRIVLPVSALNVITGSDLGIPPVSLYWGDSVVYELDATARALFKYKPASEAITLVYQGSNMLSFVSVTTTNTDLVLTINEGSPAWVGAKATLFFDALASEKPAAGGLDPIVDGGGPNP